MSGTKKILSIGKPQHSASAMESFVSGEEKRTSAPVAPTVTAITTKATKAVKTPASNEPQEKIPVKRFPLVLPEWLHMRINHARIDKNMSMNEYILEKLLSDPELQPPQAAKNS